MWCGVYRFMVDGLFTFCVIDEGWDLVVFVWRMVIVGVLGTVTQRMYFGSSGRVWKGCVVTLG